jgi:hypothetical protein
VLSSAFCNVVLPGLGINLDAHSVDKVRINDNEIEKLKSTIKKLGRQVKHWQNAEREQRSSKNFRTYLAVMFFVFYYNVNKRRLEAEDKYRRHLGDDRYLEYLVHELKRLNSEEEKMQDTPANKTS